MLHHRIWCSSVLHPYGATKIAERGRHSEAPSDGRRATHSHPNPANRPGTSGLRGLTSMLTSAQLTPLKQHERPSRELKVDVAELGSTARQAQQVQQAQHSAEAPRRIEQSMHRVIIAPPSARGSPAPAYPKLEVKGKSGLAISPAPHTQPPSLLGQITRPASIFLRLSEESGL